MLDYTKVSKIYLVCGKTDLRKGIDGLAAIIQHQYEYDRYENALFLICGVRLDSIKMLYYENDGYLLLYKRLDLGKFHWPRTKEEIRQLSHQQLRWLLEGISIDQPKAIRSGKKGIF